MIHGRGSCPGDLVGKSLVKWEETIRTRKGKLEKDKRKQHQWGEIKNSCVKEEQMEWRFFFKIINLKSEKVPRDAD